MSKTLTDLFSQQAENQREMLKKGMYDKFVDNGYEIGVSGFPVDRPILSSYHIQQLVSEIGEVLDADKRWKNFRNEKYDKDAKAEELADCFIVLMNVCMFSGLSGEDMEQVISSKIDKVSARISENFEKKG